jgi:hypothetical protein
LYTIVPKQVAGHYVHIWETLQSCHRLRDLRKY